MKHIPNPRLEVRDLRVALALAQGGTTAKAAAALHLTQPAASRALLALEDRLGVRLFERTPRGLVPTAAGERLLAGAAPLLLALGDLEQRARAPEAPPARLRLVCECYTAYHWLPTALVALRRSLPELEVSVAVEHTNDPIGALEAGRIDVALLTTARVPAGELETRRLFHDEVVFVLAATHPLAAKRALTRVDLQTYPLWTAVVPHEEARWFKKSVFGRSRPRLNFQQLPLTEAILEVTRAGLGVAVLSEWIAGPHLGRGDLVARRLRSGPLERPWRLAYRRQAREPALRLLSALRTSVPHARPSELGRAP